VTYSVSGLCGRNPAHLLQAADTTGDSWWINLSHDSRERSNTVRERQKQVTDPDGCTSNQSKLR
jgi:hypothetical protein